MSPEFAQRAFSISPPNVWEPDLATLIAAHVVTQQLVGYDAAVTGVSVDDVMRELDALPNFAALKEYDPERYGQARRTITDGFRDGLALPGVMAQAQEQLLASVARNRPIADDQTQTSVAALVADEARALASDHPDACLALLKGEHLPALIITRFYRMICSGGTKALPEPSSQVDRRIHPTFPPRKQMRSRR